MIDAISELYKSWRGKEPERLEVLPQSGSERRYFRLHEKNKTIIATYGANIKENETFIYFSNHFQKKDLPVANILAVNNDISTYLQEDFGDVSLLKILEAEGFTNTVYFLFKKSLEALANLQTQGDDGLNYHFCLTNIEFGKQAIMADLLYFK